jgi:pimeloyl-ACP methyl ester carboxylesterase
VRSRSFGLRDGRTLGWHEYGKQDGRPVLAFHGAPACRLLFAPADEPAQILGLRLIAADRPGYGLSGPMPGRTLADWASDTSQLMDHLGINRAPILAISGGGPYAVAAAAALGERISGLALVSPLGEVGAPQARAMTNALQRGFFRGVPSRPALLRRATEAVRFAFLRAPEATYGVFRAALSAADRQVLATPAARRLIMDMTAEAFRTGIEGAVSDMAIYSRPWGVDPAKIECRTMLWQGTADRIVPAALAFDLGRRLPHCAVHRLEGHGHFWVVEHIEEVLRAVASLVK